MNKREPAAGRISRAPVSLAAAVALALLPAAAGAQFYKEAKLVSDLPGTTSMARPVRSRK